MLKRVAKTRSRRREEADHESERTNGVSPRNGVSASSPRRGRNVTRSHDHFDPDGLQPAIRVVMMPRDANYLGTIFGGVILSSLDLAGAVEAHRHSDQKLVTAAMHEVKFIAPVFVGDLVSFYTEAVKIGRTSITIRVTVEAKRARPPHEAVRVTQAEVVYVAIDTVGKPVPLQL
jgi:acyl-CoA thioesterase YciA